MVITVALVAILGACSLWYKGYRQDEKGSVLAVTELIVRAAEDLKADAPVEAKTGDVYFPQARLYVPAPAEPLRLTYAYDPTEKVLSVSSRGIFGRKAAKLYQTNTVKDSFEHVPELQACQRGVSVAYTQISGRAKDLKHTARLQNGNDLYMYAEAACPDLEEVITVLKNVQSY